MSATHASTLPVLAALIALAGCSSKVSPNSAPPAATGEAEAPMVKQTPAGGEKAGAGQEAPAAKEPARRIIYTAHLEVVVDDLDAAGRELTDFVSSRGGYVVKAEVAGHTGSRRSGEWTVRVPVGQFEPLIAKVTSLGVPRLNSRDSEDVTEEFIDVEARIKNKKVQEKRLNDLMEKAAGKVEDILALEREIARVRGEIEQAEGRLSVPSRLTAMATAHVTLEEIKDYVPPTAPTYGETLGATFWRSVDALENFGKGILLFLVALVPWLPLIAVAALAIWVAFRRQRRREARAAPAP
ncbi:MAG TPA: DUF4349 domain-containing protein [Gemmataceae bacterium]